MGLPVLQSMSRKGNGLDNAIAESFFKTLKTEIRNLKLILKIHKEDYLTQQHKW